MSGNDYRELAAKLQAALDDGATEITADLRVSPQATGFGAFRAVTRLDLDRDGARKVIAWLRDQPEF